MEFRHEWKHEINYLDLLVLRQRLRAGERGGMPGAGGDLTTPGSADTNSGGTSLILLGVSAGVLLVGLIAAFKFKR